MSERTIRLLEQELYISDLTFEDLDTVITRRFGFIFDLGIEVRGKTVLLIVRH